MPQQIHEFWQEPYMTNSSHSNDSTWDASMSLRHQLAATSGQDAEAPLPESLRRELSTSPDARELHTEMQTSLKALTETAEELEELPRSVWPELKARLPQPTVPASRQKRTWQEIKETYVPIFSTVAACLAVGVVMYESQFSRNNAIYKTPTVQSPQDSAIAPASFEQSPFQSAPAVRQSAFDQLNNPQWKQGATDSQKVLFNHPSEQPLYVAPTIR